MKKVMKVTSTSWEDSRTFSGDRLSAKVTSGDASAHEGDS